MKRGRPQQIADKKKIVLALERETWDRIPGNKNEYIRRSVEKNLHNQIIPSDDINFTYDSFEVCAEIIDLGSEGDRDVPGGFRSLGQAVMITGVYLQDGTDIYDMLNIDTIDKIQKEADGYLYD